MASYLFQHAFVHELVQQARHVGHGVRHALANHVDPGLLVGLVVNDGQNLSCCTLRSSGASKVAISPLSQFAVVKNARDASMGAWSCIVNQGDYWY
jgi:hypothetical protein